MEHGVSIHSGLKMPLLPPNYDLAFTQVRDLANFVSDDSLPFFEILGVSLIECALNTRILEIVRPKDIFNPLTFDFLTDTYENPDMRIRLLRNLVYTKHIGDKLEQTIQEKLFQIVDSYLSHTHKQSARSFGLLELYNLYIWRDLTLSERCNRCIQMTTLSVLHQVDPKLIVYDPKKLRSVIQIFTNSLNAYLSEMDFGRVISHFGYNDKDIANPQWWLKFTVAKLFGTDYVIFDADEFKLDQVLKEMAEKGSWLNLHIMANSSSIDIPLSYDRKVIAKKKSPLFLIVTGELGKESATIEKISNYYCYRGNINSLIRDIVNSNNVLRTITTTDKSYDYFKESFRVQIPDFEVPPKTNFVVYITIQNWYWILKQWKTLSRDKSSLLYIDSKRRMHFIISRAKERHYYFTAFDDTVLVLLYQEDNRLFEENLASAKETAIGLLEDREVIDAAISLYFLGIANRL